MLGTDFVPVGSQDNTLLFEDFIVDMSGVVPCKYSDRATKAATIYKRVGEAYKTYYYVSDAYSQDEDDEDLYEGWCDGSSTLVTYTPKSEEDTFEAYNITLDIGEGVWFRAAGHSGAVTLTLAGQVKSDGKVEKTVQGDTYYMIAPGLPVDYEIAKIATTGTACKYSERSTKANTIYRRVGEAYKTYYYVSDAYSQDEDDEELYEGWCDGSSTLTSYTPKSAEDTFEGENITITAGEGIWFKPNTDAQVKLTFDLNN